MDLKRNRFDLLNRDIDLSRFNSPSLIEVSVSVKFAIVFSFVFSKYSFLLDVHRNRFKLYSPKEFH